MSRRRIITLLALITCLAGVNWSIFKKERHLADGQSILIELAPVDPRSLMQGDYMALNFKMADQIRAELAKAQISTRASTRASARIAKLARAEDGFALVNVDTENRATFRQIYRGQKLSSSDRLIRYRLRNGEVKFATNAFFFQEGQAKRYEQARYGHFRIDSAGELLLTSMHDESLKDLASLTTQ
jgi:uncharacterized membrane-anchored protein